MQKLSRPAAGAVKAAIIIAAAVLIYNIAATLFNICRNRLGKPVPIIFHAVCISRATHLTEI